MTSAVAVQFWVRADCSSLRPRPARRPCAVLWGPDERLKPHSCGRTEAVTSNCDVQRLDAVAHRLRDR